MAEQTDVSMVTGLSRHRQSPVINCTYTAKAQSFQMALDVFTVTHILSLYKHKAAELTMQRQVIYTEELQTELEMY